MNSSRQNPPPETTRRHDNPAGSFVTGQRPEAGPGAVPHPSQEDIARRAYERWESDGRQEGRDQDHWYSAEKELRGRGDGDEREETRREEP